MEKEYKVGDKVSVSDWGKLYSSVFKYNKGRRSMTFPWKYELRDIYSESPSYHHKRDYTPKLTLKGEPYKSGERTLLSDEPIYKGYEYEIIEVIPHPTHGRKVYLLSSKEGCVVQIGEGGLTLKKLS